MAHAELARCARCNANGLALNVAKTSLRDDRKEGACPATHPRWIRLVEMTGLSDWPRNRLLLALPSPDLERLMAELEHVRCERGQTLVHADSPLDRWWARWTPETRSKHMSAVARRQVGKMLRIMAAERARQRGW